MKISQFKWKDSKWHLQGSDQVSKPQLCILFGTRETLEDHSFYEALRKFYPTSKIVSCSTAGNIIGEELIDDVIIATCIEFDYTRVETQLLEFENFSEETGMANGKKLGISLAQMVSKDELAYVLLLSTNKINAGNFLEGVNTVINGEVPISGGIAGDNFKFEKTLVGLNDNIGEDRVIAVSFHGKRLHTYHGSRGGWDTFGPKRTVTKCDSNVLYEIDGQPALDLYKKYLGENKSKELPGAALHFPIAIIDPQTNEFIVRGVQNVDEEKNSLILFGDVFEGDAVQLTKANFDRVIEGAHNAALDSNNEKLGDPDLSILISCVARRLVLDQLTEEELSEAKSSLGEKTKICGFYSYSELSPVVGDNCCHLHNQTMTITSLYEK